MKLRPTIVIVALGCIALTGCSFDKATQPFQDAPRTGAVNKAPADVITLPDGFTNLTSKCDGPNRIYVSYHGNSAYAAITAVPGDPRCAR